MLCSGHQVQGEEQGGLLPGYSASEKEPCVVVNPFTPAPLTYGLMVILTTFFLMFYNVGGMGSAMTP